MSTALTLLQLPAHERPREKLLQHGPLALSDAELLALLLRHGDRGRNAVVMAQDILAHAGGLPGLMSAQSREMSGWRGLGPARQAELVAVFEMARRALRQPLQERPVFAQAQTLQDFVQLQLQGRAQEIFGIVFLDAAMRLLHWEEMFRGTIHQTSVYPREIARRALEVRAVHIVLVHNHPSGRTEPSLADRSLTASLLGILAPLDIQVVEHLIVGHGKVLSFRENGWI